MIQRTLELSYDRLVIGSDLSAFSYCYENDCPAIYTRLLKPYKYNEKENWERATDIWGELAYALSMSEKTPFSDKVVSLRLEEDNILKAITKYGLVCKIKYNNLLISDDYGIEGLPAPVDKTDNNNWVIDWFNVRQGMFHPLDYINDKEDDFVKKIYFYLSTRTYNAEGKDLVAVSKIKDSDLNKDDFDQNIARIKVIKMMKDAGIKGIKRGHLFYPVKLESTKRDVHPLGKNIYKDLPSGITMLY